jgi:hypothetical protein
MKQPLFLFLMAVTWQGTAPAADVYVSPAGRDRNSGAKDRPLATLGAAQRMARSRKSAGPVTVWLRGGTYCLPQTLVFTPEDSGTEKAPVTYAAFPGEEPVISGRIRLRLTWIPYRDGILMARVPAGLHSDQLFVNGKRQILARYPNYDPAAAYFNGWSPDAFSNERAARWKDPRGGYIHAMHRNMWGDFHYLITSRDTNGNVTYEGGWQNNRRMGMHDKYRFVENILRGTRRAW